MMMHNTIQGCLIGYLALAMALALSGAATAATGNMSASETSALKSHTVTAVGPTATNALAMQASGRNGVEVTPMLDDVALRVYERYLKSFDNPIPQFFEEQTFTPNGGSGGGGGGASR